MPTSSDRRSAARSSESPERLFVLSLVASVVLLMLAIVVIVLQIRKLDQQAAQLDTQARAMKTMAREVETLRSRDASSPESVAASRPTTSATAPIAAVADDQATSRPAGASQTVEDAALEAAIEALARRGDDLPLDLIDPGGAAVQLRKLLGEHEALELPPTAAARLAAIAELAGEEGLASVLAQRAAAGPAVLDDYFEIAARRRLAAGRIDEAISLAAQLKPRGGEANHMRLLAGELARARGDWKTLDLALDRLSEKSLNTSQRVRFAALAASRSRWDRAERALTGVRGDSPAESARVQRTKAEIAVGRGRFAEAIAILDHLLESAPADAELRILRAAALVRARQYSPARAALHDIVAKQPRAAAAWYWLARLEFDCGKPEAATDPLQRAIGADPRDVAARELLGRLSLDEADRAVQVGDRETADRAAATAVASLEAAVVIDESRSSSLLLLAIAYAKVTRDADALRVLEQAIRLDPSLAAAARAADVLQRIAPAEKINEWVRDAETPP